MAVFRLEQEQEGRKNAGKNGSGLWAYWAHFPVTVWALPLHDERESH